MGTGQLRDWCRKHWAETRELLDTGIYRPSPVRQVLIPKPDGGQRKLGVPTALDRMIQQAIAQVLVPVFDPGFVSVSYGFRPNRSAHQAVRAAQWALQHEFRWVVEVDLDAFFDRVHHDMLMARVARKVSDKRLLKLIRAYIEAGIMADGVLQPTTMGTPQGSPLSPLLSNIMLDDFDQEMRARGLRHVRYADDIRIFVKSERAAARVLDSATRVLEQRLQLKVNRQKSSITTINTAVLLGFGFFVAGGQVKVRVSRKAWDRMKTRIRVLTSRRWSVSMAYRLRRLNDYVRGWMGYFRLAQTPGKFDELDGWYRRRLRQCRWKEWKQPSTRTTNLIALGARVSDARAWGGSGRGYWVVAGTPILHRTLTNAYWQRLGLLTFTDAWARFH